jgi:signal transduction histidine kinase
MSQTQFEQIEAVLAELEQSEQRLDQLQMELARSHRLATLGTLAAIVAHEFNNLLTPVISYCQLALKQEVADDPELVRKALTRSHEGAAKAAQIATSMLGFARNEDADATSHIATVVNDVFTCLARDPAKDGITLSLDIDDALAVSISPLYLQQVILNLILNARNAMRPSAVAWRSPPARSMPTPPSSPLPTLARASPKPSKTICSSPSSPAALIPATNPAPVPAWA